MRARPTAEQRQCMVVVARLWAELGHAPSATDVGRELGITRVSARSLMLRCKAKGWMRSPERVDVGEWALTASGKREIDV